MNARVTLFALLLMGYAQTVSGQELYAIKATSNWNDNTAWSRTSGGLACLCTPTATDDVYTDGKLVVVNVSGSCKNLLVTYDLASSVTISAFQTLTITGSLTGWDPAGPSPSPPIASVLKHNTGSVLRFTGANLDAFDPYVIFAWNSDQPIGAVTFALAGVSKNLLLPLAFSGNVILSAGTLTADAGATVSGTSFSISSGATFITNDNVGPFTTITVTGTLNTQDGSASISSTNLTSNTGGIINASGPISVSNNITVTGSLAATNTVAAGNLTINNLGSFTPSNVTTITNTLTINSGGTVNASGGITTVTSQISGTLTTSNYFNNSGTLNLNAGGNLSTSYTGGTQSWWSGSSNPAAFNADATSTVTFSANSSQNVFSQTYGNLTLSGAGTKTVNGSGSLTVKGNLVVGSPFNSDAASSIFVAGSVMSNAAWSPADPVTFNGTATQQIGGPVQPTFAGGLEVNKSAGTLSLLRSISISNGLTITQGTLVASNYTTTLNGNLTNSGTLSFGSGASLGTLIIDGTTTVSGTVPSFGHLTINSTRSFTSNGMINIAGNITNNGTFNVTGVAFNGTTPQSISGTLTLSNLIVRDAADVSNLGTINMSTSGVVTLEGTALFDAGVGGTNTLRLQSTSLSNGARIATLPNPDAFSGNVTAERYINSPEDWRYLAFPVENPNVGMIKDDFPVTGNFTDASPVGGNVINSTSPSIYYLNAGQWAAVGSGGSVAATTLSNTIGYSIWSYLSSGVALDVDGQIGKGPKGLSIRAGDNLLPNPYPSAIDWDLVNFTGANLSTNTVYVRTSNGQYASYAGGMATGNHPLGSNWNGQIAMGQSFWVVGAGSGTLTIQEDDKVGSTNFVREVQPKDYIRIRLKKDAISDDVIVHFKEDATLNSDASFDAPKKLNDIKLNISTYNDDPANDFAINGVPFVTCEFVAKIKLASTNPVGDYSLAFEDLVSMTTGYEMSLVDKFLGQTQKISEGESYRFSITTDPASSGASRFEVIFKPAIDELGEVTMTSTADCNTGNFTVLIENSQPGVNYQFTLYGSTLGNPVVGNGGTVTAYIPGDGLSLGDHSLNLQATSRGGCQSLEFTNALTIAHEDIPAVTAISSTTACVEGNVTLVASGAPLNGQYRWYESEDAATPIDGVNTAEFVTPVINKSRTYYVSAVNSSGCETSIRVAMQAVVSHPDVPVITAEGDILKTADGLGTYLWYLNGEEIEGSGSSAYHVTKSGTYSVTTSLNGCSVSSADFEYLVNGSEHETLAGYYDVYPNPVQNIVTLRGPDLEHSRISLYDQSGKEIEIKGALEKDDDGTTVFVTDLSSLKHGVYLLNCEKNSRLIQLKIIKQ
jgi:hypothetical protein